MKTHRLAFANDLIDTGAINDIRLAMFGDEANDGESEGITFLVDQDMIKEELEGPNDSIRDDLEILLAVLVNDCADFIAL